ncbi:MAG: hypothetical protein U1F37_13955 [Alphaproteobacteria bacterium]
MERRGARRRERARHRRAGDRGGVALDDTADGGGAARGAFGGLVEARDHLDRGRDMGRRQRAALGHAVEQRILLEAPHDDEPVERFARAADRERAVGAPHQRHDPAIELGRRAPVDAQLLLAGGAALLDRRVVDVGELHRALQLHRAIAGQEDVRDVGVDALDRAGRAVRLGALEECDERGLLRHRAQTAAPGTGCGAS